VKFKRGPNICSAAWCALRSKKSTSPSTNSVVIWCYRGVVVVLQWCYIGVTMVSQ
jgi:hypothetical protein